MYKLINIQLAYIGLEPKSPHISKYSQPLQLVLFNVIALRIKCLKGFYYPHLLNSYLINFLNFSSLTFPPPLNIFVLENMTYQETSAGRIASCDPPFPRSSPE